MVFAKVGHSLRWVNDGCENGLQQKHIVRQRRQAAKPLLQLLMPQHVATTNG
jgi:hypothetical protein